MEQTQNPKIKAIMNKESTSTGPPASNGQQPKLKGDLNAFNWYQILTLDYVVG